MRPELGFAGKRVIKIKGGRKGRRGLIQETLMSGTWRVLFDDTRLVDTVNPYEFELEEVGARLLSKQN